MAGVYRWRVQLDGRVCMSCGDPSDGKVEEVSGSDLYLTDGGALVVVGDQNVDGECAQARRKGTIIYARDVWRCVECLGRSDG